MSRSPRFAERSIAVAAALSGPSNVFAPTKTAAKREGAMTRFLATLLLALSIPSA
jgi:hypothetical protein